MILKYMCNDNGKMSQKETVTKNKKILYLKKKKKYFHILRFLW